MSEPVLLTFLFLFGAVIGSFLNVCIARIPERESVVFPGSRCPSCKKSILWYDNVPLLSYILLGAKCRHCSAPIAFRYFLVELLTPLLLLALYLRFGLSPVLPIAFAFTAALVVITFIDLRHQIIPDVISIPGTLLCCALSFLLPWLDPLPVPFTGTIPAPAGKVLQSLTGMVAGGGVLYLFAQAYLLLAKREGMGMGDVKLLAMIGAFLGWKGALCSLMVGALSGSIVGIVLMAVARAGLKYRIPFGPFLSFGALCSLFYGGQIMQWYLGIGR